MKKQKRSLTLLEIMIVIVLIGLIGSVVGFNMKGSLDEGKAFKTRQAKDQIVDILMLEVARGASVEEVVKEPEAYLRDSGMIKNPKEFLNDGWGVPFEIKVTPHGNISVKSLKLLSYERKKKSKAGKASSDVAEQEDAAE